MMLLAEISSEAAESQTVLDNFKCTTSEEPIVLYQAIAAFSSSEFPPELALSNNPEH